MNENRESLKNQSNPEFAESEMEKVTRLAVLEGNYHTVNDNVTQVYERKNYDNPYARKKFSDKTFDGKKTTVDATGQTVHSSHKAASNKYKSNASLHQSETDHIDPLKNIQSRHKSNAYLSDTDIKDVANREGNFQILNKNKNTSKGAKTEFEVGIETKDAKRVVEGAKKKLENDTLLAGRTAKNVYVQAKTLAPQAASIALVATIYDATNLLPDLLSGKISKEDYAKHIAATGGKTFLISEGLGIVLPQINHMLTNSSIKAFQMVGDSGYIGAVISVGMIIANSSVRLANGEISAKECAEEIVTSGLALAANFFIGAGLGPVAGPIASIALSAVYSSVQKVIAINNSINEEHQQRIEMLNVIADYIEGELKNQSEKLDVIFAEVKNEWDSSMTLAFKNINAGILNDDPKTINDGIDMILNQMNVKAKFNSASDFRSFLDSSDRTLTI